MEKWVDIHGYEGWYKISDKGRVMRVRRGQATQVGRVLKAPLNSYGYPVVDLYKNGVRNCVAIHLLVARAFLGVCPNGMECCHNDGDSTNVTLSNIRYDTHINNMADQKIHGTSTTGVSNGFSKLTEEAVRSIRSMAKEGISYTAIGKRFSVTRQNVSLIARRLAWTHV